MDNDIIRILDGIADHETRISVLENSIPYDEPEEEKPVAPKTITVDQLHSLKVALADLRNTVNKHIDASKGKSNIKYK